MIRIDHDGSLKLFVKDEHGHETRLDGFMVEDVYMARKEAIKLLTDLTNNKYNTLHFNFPKVHFVHLCYDYLERWELKEPKDIEICSTDLYLEFKTAQSQIIFISCGRQNGLHVYWQGDFTDKMMKKILAAVMNRVITQTNGI